MAICKGPNCGAEIIFATTEAGRLQPLNAVPDDAGNVVAVADGRKDARGNPVVEVLGPLELLVDERIRYMPHHATCPDVEWFRQEERRWGGS